MRQFNAVGISLLCCGEYCCLLVFLVLSLSSFSAPWIWRIALHVPYVLCLSVSTVQSTASLFVRFDSISVTSARRLLPVLLYCTCSQTTPACIEILHNHLNLIVTIVCSVCHIQRQGDDRFSIFISKGKNIWDNVFGNFDYYLCIEMNRKKNVISLS